MESEVYLLNFRDDERREAFSESVALYNSFSEAVPKFDVGKGRRIVVLISFETQVITHIAYGVKGNLVVTMLHSLRLTNVENLEEEVRFSDIISTVTPAAKSRVLKALEKGTKLPKATRNHTINVIKEKNPSINKFLQHFSTRRKKFIDSLGNKEKEVLSLQKDSLCMALDLGGMPKSLSTQWDAPEDESKSLGSFLELFPEGDVSDGDFFEDELFEEEPVAGEDLKISIDWSRVPGFDESFIHQEHAAIRRFLSRENPDRQLTVIMTNREALENQTGADLIYQNDTDKSFIMVQYKSMNSEYGGEKVFRWSENGKFMEQVDRMNKVLEDLSGNPVTPNSENYRFTENPFFLKICKPTDIKPDDTGMMRGMYLPLEYWKRGNCDGRFVGDKGGKYIGYNNVGRHINNSDFIRYVSGGWIGTPVDQFRYLNDMIRYLVGAKRNVTYALLQAKSEISTSPRYRI